MAHVALSYTPPPTHREVFEPPDVEHRVAVGRVDVDWRVRCRGDRDSARQTVVRYRLVDGEGKVMESTVESKTTWDRNLRGNARIWDDALRSEVRKLLAEYARKAGVKLVLVDRDHLKQRLDERDLSVIGLTPGDPEDWKGAELGVDAFIFARLNIDTVYESSYKKLIPGDFLDGVIGGIPGRIVGGLFKPKHRVRRTMTLEGDLQLVDGRTGRIWATHDISQQWVENEKSLFRDKDVMDLEPEEERIRQALRAAASEFVGMFFPVPRRFEIYVRSSSNDFAKMGARALRVQDYEQALEFFQAALREKPDDHRSLFGAGVACEALGRLDEALRYYKKAVFACDKRKIDEDDDEYQYTLAVRRVRRRLASEPSAGRRPMAAVEPPNRQAADPVPQTTQPSNVPPSAQEDHR